MQEKSLVFLRRSVPKEEPVREGGREGGLHKPCGGMDIFVNYKIKVDYDYSCIIYLSSYQEMDSGQNQIRLSSVSFDFFRLAHQQLNSQQNRCLI